MVPLVEGSGAGFSEVVRGGLPVEMREKRRGWGGDRQRNQQVNAHAFVKTTFSKQPLVFSRIGIMSENLWENFRDHFCKFSVIRFERLRVLRKEGHKR